MKIIFPEIVEASVTCNHDSMKNAQNDINIINVVHEWFCRA